MKQAFKPHNNSPWEDSILIYSLLISIDLCSLLFQFTLRCSFPHRLAVASCCQKRGPRPVTNSGIPETEECDDTSRIRHYTSTFRTKWYKIITKWMTMAGSVVIVLWIIAVPPIVGRHHFSQAPCCQSKRMFGIIPRCRQRPTCPFEKPHASCAGIRFLVVSLRSELWQQICKLLKSFKAQYCRYLYLFVIPRATVLGSFEQRCGRLEQVQICSSAQHGL